MKDLILLPAYGRQYKSKSEVLKDWEAGKDFQISMGPYCSVRDVGIMKQDGYTDIIFARHNGTSICRITL